MQLAGLIDLIFDQSNNCVLPADDQITWWPWHEERIVREVTYLRYKFISWLVDCCTWGDTHVNIQICTTSYIFTLRESRLRGNSSHIRHATTDRVREGDKRNMSCLIQRWNQVYVANLYSEPRTQAVELFLPHFKLMSLMSLMSLIMSHSIKSLTNITFSGSATSDHQKLCNVNVFSLYILTERDTQKIFNHILPMHIDAAKRRPKSFVPWIL